MASPLQTGGGPSSSRVARSVNFLSGLDRCYHPRTRIKIGPTECIDCHVRMSQTFLWGLHDTGSLRHEFLRGNVARTFSLLGGAGSYGRKHLPTIPRHSIDLQDGPGDTAPVVHPGAPASPREPHRPARADPGDRPEGRAAEQRADLREDRYGEDRRRQEDRERVPQGGRRADGPVLLPQLRDRRHALRRPPIDRQQADGEFHQRIPFTGLSTDRVYNLLREKLDEEKRVVIVALDEIDKIVQKNGDDILYQLLKINDDLSKARVSLIGISNDLKFTEYLDPRVRSRLADEKMVFPPYNAEELFDILSERARLAFENGTAEDGVLHLIAALAAQEHGDA